MQSVILRNMREDEFAAFRERSIADYAQSLIDAGKCSKRKAKAQAQKEFSQVLSGLSPENNHLLIAENKDGIPVGMLWYETKKPEQAFILDFLVYDAHRRMGYGSAILAELERTLRAAETPSVLLHVFAHNVPAIKLYEKCGFTVAKSDNGNIYMQKALI